MPLREERWEDGSCTKYYYSDSNASRLERLEDYSTEGRMTMAVDYRYDARGENAERVVRDGSGKLLRRLSFEFDAEGREATQREYNAANVLEWTIRFEYMTQKKRKVTTTYVSGKEHVEIENID